MSRNFFLFLNYAGQDFRHSYKIGKKAEDICYYYVDSVLKENLNRFALKNEVNLTMSVFTTCGTHAISNNASVKFEPNENMLKDSLDYLKYRINHKFDNIGLPLRVFKIFDVADHFCARKHALNCDYVFRFSYEDKKDLEIFEYPFTTCVQSNLKLSSISENLNRLNQYTLQNNTRMFGDEYNFNVRKHNLEPVKFILKEKPGQFLSSNVYSTESIYTLEMRNLPVESGFWMFNLLNSLFSNSNDLIDQFSQLVKVAKEDTTQPNRSDPINYLNGLFLVNVNFNLNDYLTNKT